MHSGKGVFATNAAVLAVRSEGVNAEEIEVEHPVVCRHPVSGRRHLMIGRVLQRFAGMTEAESRPLIDFLMDHAVRPEFTCRVRWAPGHAPAVGQPLPAAHRDQRLSGQAPGRLSDHGRRHAPVLMTS